MYKNKLKLIINADDFGITRSVSDAVVNAHLNGALTSATLLSGAPYAAYAAERARGCPSLNVGIHFQLVAGRPVTPDLNRIKTLIDSNGMFPENFIDFFKRLHIGHIDRNHVKIELINQIKRAFALGVKPTHADSHQHLHMHPYIIGPVIEAMREAGICRLRNPVEIYDYKLHRPLTMSAGNIIKILYMNPLYKKWFNSRLVSAGILFPRFFFGQFFSGSMKLDVILKFLSYFRSRLDENGYAGKFGVLNCEDLFCEIMTHPGQADEYNDIECCDAAFKKYSWREEFEALISPELKSAVADNGFELCGYSALT